MEKDRVRLVKNAIELFESLNSAITQAGVMYLAFEQMEKMSVVELFEYICTNNIRFTFVDPDKNKRTK